jgi:hypothetical protein
MPWCLVKHSDKFTLPFLTILVTLSRDVVKVNYFFSLNLLARKRVSTDMHSEMINCKL